MPVTGRPDAMDQLILDADQVEARAEQRVEGPAGVHRAILWEQGGSTAGLLWVDPDTRMDEHTHERHRHHIWVLEGGANVLERELEAGSYAFVADGVPHALAAGPDGCELFYLYLEV